MSDTALPDQSPDAPQPTLSDDERARLGRMLGFPLDLPPEFVTWLLGQMQVLLTAGNIQGLSARVACVGDIKIVALDLTAQTGLYPYEDAQGTWLYLNGNSFTAADYPKLNAFLGGTTLPDTRGRSIWLTGTNAATDLFDNDAVTESSRQPKHTHSDTFSISGTPSFTDPGHTHSVPRGSSTVIAGSGASNAADTAGATTGSSTTGASVGKGTLAISGSVGTGMSGSDAIAHIVLGSALIKAD